MSSERRLPISGGQRPPVTRVILLGASNLTIAFPMVLQTLDCGLAGPLEIFAAHGHGRSYGTWSRLLFRALPSIRGCGLWDAAAGVEPRPAATFALVTDVGNDLLYGASPEQISGWIGECLSRLAALGAQSVLTLLPVASIERLSAVRYRLTRLLFFPGRGAPLKEMLARARELNGRLADLGREYGAQIVEQPLEWFGFDPIHIRMTQRPGAWQRILSCWSGYQGTIIRPALRGRWRSVTARPAERRLFGYRQCSSQPTLKLAKSAVCVY